eukprot:1136650-Pelagomonas_calceolata.AAC.1
MKSPYIWQAAGLAQTVYLLGRKGYKAHTVCLAEKGIRLTQCTCLAEKGIRLRLLPAQARTPAWCALRSEPPETSLGLTTLSPHARRTPAQGGAGQCGTLECYTFKETASTCGVLLREGLCKRNTCLLSMFVLHVQSAYVPSDYP